MSESLRSRISQRGQGFCRHCRSLPGVTEDVKWGDNLVFSVGLRMFGVLQLPDLDRLSFKAAADTRMDLLQQPGVQPAPYLARAGWVTMTQLDALPSELTAELLTESHRLVAAKLSKKARDKLRLIDS